MSTDTPAEALAHPLAAPALPPGDPGEPFDERALLAHYVLRDFENAVAEVEQTLRAADADMAAAAGTPGAGGDTDDEAATQRRQDIARSIVTGAWLNRHNPDWDPALPETHRPDPNDPLLALLKDIAAKDGAGAAAEAAA
ncbi:hypothetical protein M4R22_05535 [Acidovorax sp. GBBC 3334]|uniref:hypothetical protein n=1 Tax=Acidovorax sp. GBBC 3334 TaxID=2940496 RepID=UPI002304CE3E|nr:hypothetical protein [Acidovorax sp. GBBC 3334]MDA8454219.1 hypothetical protein [Acidovorax sp. GBBC 3334]